MDNTALQANSILQGTVVKRGAIYARVSTDDQAENGTSIDTQVEADLVYANDHKIYVPKENIFKEDFTGKVLDRPELKKVRELIRAGKIDVLIVYKPNRLDRSEWGINLLLLMRELKSFGVELHYSRDKRQVDLHNPMESFMYGNFAGWQAGEDHRETVVKLWKGRIAKVKKGSVMVHGKPPYGYEVVNTGTSKNPFFELKEHPKEADIVRQIYNWALFGDESGKLLGSGAIATKLSQMNIPTRADGKRKCYNKKAPEGKWSSSTIRLILSNRTYTGWWEYTKRHKKTAVVGCVDLNAVPVPVIIPPELWQLVQSKKQGSNNKVHEYLLSGRVICGECGYRMFGVTRRYKDHLNQYYRCPARQTDRTRPCDNKHYKANRVEDELWKWLTEIFTDETGESLKDGLIGYRNLKRNEVGPVQRDLELATDERENLESRLESLYHDYQEAGNRWLKSRLESDMGIIETQLEKTNRKIELLTQELSEKTVTEAEEVGLLEFAKQTRKDWQTISQDYDSRQAILNRFNIQVELKLVDGKRKAIVTGKIIPTEKILSVENTSLEKRTSR